MGQTTGTQHALLDWGDWILMKSPWLAVLPLVCPDMSSFLEAKTMKALNRQLNYLVKPTITMSTNTAPWILRLRNMPSGASHWALDIMPKCQRATVVISLSIRIEDFRKPVKNRNSSFLQDYIAPAVPLPTLRRSLLDFFPLTFPVMH